MPPPITHRALKKRGRKPKRPPADAVERIGELAKTNCSIIGIAHGLGVGKDAFAGWLERYPEIREAFDLGRERERAELHGGLAEQARKGNITAAIFLLKARHGYREGDQSDQSGRVNVTIALPGAMSLAQFNGLKPSPDTTPAIERDTPND
jgi:hypothetical protein